ncbi:hypothetical protein ACQP2T_41395 [Nonomuraea sp. CA-143628]|uniref:hypothetical protein n=1 Tax=Nonomuraea sp. CA-143628 TaxID=3239997 RepID=UPI003D8CC124
MAGLLRAVDDEVPISHRRFELFDECGELDDEDAVQTGSLCTSIASVEIESAYGAANATVRLEAWDEEPPPPGDLWVGKGETVYLSVTGVVSMFGPGVGGTGEKLLIGPPFFAYGLRAYAAPPADQDEYGRAVAEPWLLRFWPLCDAAGPAIGPESVVLGEEARRMTAVLPLDPSDADVMGDWPALRPLPAPEPAQGTLVVSFGPLYEGGDVDPGRFAIPEEESHRQARVEEILGDLRFELMTAPPPHLETWSDDRLSRYLTELQADLRIARELNPDGQPTLRLDADVHVSLPLGGPWPGFSGRAWVWSADDTAHSDVLARDRQVITRDPIRRCTLLTGIVTILRKEGERVEVRAATVDEAERVLAAERIRA